MIEVMLSRLKIPSISEATLFVLMNRFNVPIDLPIVMRQRIHAKYTVNVIISVNLKVIYRKEKYQRFPKCLWPTRLYGESNRLHAFGEFNIEVCEKCPNRCIASTLQAKWRIESFVIALFHGVHIQMFDRTCIRYNLENMH